MALKKPANMRFFTIARTFEANSNSDPPSEIPDFFGKKSPPIPFPSLWFATHSWKVNQWAEHLSLVL